MHSSRREATFNKRQILFIESILDKKAWQTITNHKFNLNMYSVDLSKTNTMQPAFMKY